MTRNHFLISTNGVPIPKIIYGTAWKKDRTAELVEQAVTLGFRGIDTAGQPKHYDESGVGAGLHACFKHGLKRSDLYLQSKFTPVEGQDPAKFPYDPEANPSEQVRQSFANSLTNLRTDYLDCLILHFPLAEEKASMAIWRAMESIVEEGSVKQLGISNCYDQGVLERLYEKAAIKPAVLQNRFYAQTGYDRALRAFCRKQGICYQSFWTLTANPGILAHESLQHLAARYHRTPAQIFFRYLSEIGIIPLTGTETALHMQQDLAIFEFGLSAQECEAIETLLS